MNNFFNRSHILSRVFLSLNLVSIMAMAGTDLGNGGDAVLRGDRAYSMDLVEAGLEQNASVDLAKADPSISDRLTRIFGGFQIPTETLSAKLAEIGEVSAPAQELLLVAMDAYEWRWVDASLIDINDENSVVDPTKNSVVQAAIRKQNVVRIDRAIWSKMDDLNKAALILHEVIYAVELHGSSAKTRELVARLFSSPMILYPAVEPSVLRTTSYLYQSLPLIGTFAYWEAAEFAGNPCITSVVAQNKRDSIAIFSGQAKEFENGSAARAGQFCSWSPAKILYTGFCEGLADSPKLARIARKDTSTIIRIGDAWTSRIAAGWHTEGGDHPVADFSKLAIGIQVRRTTMKEFNLVVKPEDFSSERSRAALVKRCYEEGFTLQQKYTFIDYGMNSRL